MTPKMISRSFMIGALLLAGISFAETVTLPTPIGAEVYVKGKDKATPLRGHLISYDDEQFTMHVGSEDKTLSWADITPPTAYALRMKVVVRNSDDQTLRYLLQLGPEGKPNAQVGQVLFFIGSEQVAARPVVQLKTTGG